MHAAARLVMLQQRLSGDPTPAGDRVHDNRAWAGAKPKLSIAVPTFRYDASPLIEALAADPRGGEVEIIIHDDGSQDKALTAGLEATADRVSMPVRIVSAARNRGRSGARNAAIGQARAEWVLLLDSDMLPDTPAFLSNYLDALAGSGPKLIVGGYSLRHAPDEARFALHRWQAARSECLSADERMKDAGRHVFTSNVLVHRDVIAAHDFDEDFSGWGWEDVDWGLRVAKDFPVLHIDNTATHLGLDEDAALISKYTRSAGNFALLAWRHPMMATTPLFRAASVCQRLPLRPALASTAEKIARDQRLPIGLRGRALKLVRALAYAEAL